MAQQIFKENNKRVIRFFRSPTLETVNMVELTIKRYSGKFKKTQIWEKLPRKVMWPTYLVILNYLEETNKIITSENGILVYIWDSKGVRNYLTRKSY